MSQRVSGYERFDAERYETPGWVVDCLLAHVPIPEPILEPACGTGKMVRALSDRMPEAIVFGQDIHDYGSVFQNMQSDFLDYESTGIFHSIVTNPPYGKGGRLATAFIEHALKLMEPVKGTVAMLLPSDFDHAKGRRHLFAEHPAFAARIVLHSRIRWVEGSTGSPSANHAWFVWNWWHRGPAHVLYATKESEE